MSARGRPRRGARAPRLAHLLAAAALGGSAALIVGLSSWGALAEPPPEGHAPDPPARASRKQWIVDVKVTGGVPQLAGARSVVLKEPRSTARVMGRYALELYVGRELLDRIRFDVPLTGDGPTPDSDKRPFRRPGFEQVNTKLSVRIADNPRATYALFVDRAKGTKERLAWPIVPPESDAGAPDGGGPDGGGPDGGGPSGGAQDAGPGPGEPPPSADAGRAP